MPKSKVTYDTSFVPPNNISDWHVLHALAHFHNAENGAFVKEKTIVAWTGLHRTTVSRSYKNLQKADLLRIIYRSGRRVFRLPVNEKNYLLGGPDRWAFIEEYDSRNDVANTRKDVATSLHRNEPDVAKRLHECSETATSDVADSHQSVANSHTERSESATCIYNAPARGTTLNILYEHTDITTPLPPVEDASLSSHEREKKKTLPAPVDPEVTRRSLLDELERSMTSEEIKVAKEQAAKKDCSNKSGA